MKKILKATYRLLPFKHFVFKIVRAVFRPGKNVYRHLHFKGIIRVPIDKTHEFKIYHYGYQIENEFFWAGYESAWEKVSLNYWKELCKISDVIVDVGANTGIYALIAKSMNAGADVYAFEPIDRNFEKLVYNCNLNEYKIHCEKKALSDSDGSAVVYEELSNDIIYSVTVNKSLVEITGKVVKTPIEIVRLDHFIEQKKIQKIDLIKIDVETHEPEVLNGFGVYLQKFQPTMLIEILNDEVALKVEALLKDLPYLYFNIDEKSGIRKVEHLSKSDYFNFLICKKETAEKLGL